MLVMSCGTTQIVTHSNHSIIVNNKHKGNGKAELCRSGFPKKFNIQIEKNGKVVDERVIKRRLTLRTGVYTYLFGPIGFITNWQLDKEVKIATEDGNKEEENIWEKDPEINDIWNN